jgi:polypeptide N-acetylgalactosaminyltransferase
LVKILVLPERAGLIWSRLAGARAASGDVLLFLDSHVEVSTNFLPPLLEPIAKDYKTCVCPIVDSIDHKTFQYVSAGSGARRTFNWQFGFEFMPVRNKDRNHEWEDYETPVMAGET